MNDFTKISLTESGRLLATARTLAAACKLTYAKDPEAIRSQLGRWGLEVVDVFDWQDTRGFVAADDQVAVLAFGGTRSVADWIRDMPIRRTDVPMGKMNSSFHESLEVVWNRHIEPALRPLANSRHKIWFTGHSLGAALATAAAARAHGWLEIAGCYTFGQPLVGNADFARNFRDAYQSRYFRFVNNCDVVTKIPPAPLYSHVDTRYQIGADGRVSEEVAERSAQAEPEALDVAQFKALQQRLANLHTAGQRSPCAMPAGVLPHPVAIHGAEDHDIENGYLRQLRRASGQPAHDSPISGKASNVKRQKRLF